MMRNCSTQTKEKTQEALSDYEDNDDSEESLRGPSHDAAPQALKTVMEWYENQYES